MPKKSKNKENSVTERKKDLTPTERLGEPKTTPAIVSGSYPKPVYDGFERRIHSLRRSTYAEDRERERERERDQIRREAFVSSTY